MNKVRYYKIPTALEVATRYASAAGITVEEWQKLDAEKREDLQKRIDAVAKKAQRNVRAADRARHYASVLGMKLSDWLELSKDERKAKKDEIDAREKEERKRKWEEELRHSANEKLKRDAKKMPHKKRSKKSVSVAFPGPTRYSTVVGLMESPSSRKWNLFLREGPYWNYLVSHISRSNLFKGRRDRVEEAVMNACEKIGKFMVSKRYKYQEEGKGYFRGFIKKVAFRTALDLFREITRQEQVRVKESKTDAISEFDKMKDDMDKATAKCRLKLEKENAALESDDEIGSVSDHDLDVYDASAGLCRDITPKKKQTEEFGCISSLDFNPFSDDEAPVNYNPAEMFDFKVKLSEADLGWVRKLQIHVLYIALGYVLTNEKVPAERRELLRLRYGQDMTMKDIYALPRFAHKGHGAVDTQMSHARDVLRDEVASWWKLVAPDKNDFADETVLKCWRELGRKEERAEIASKLQGKAIGIAGRIK